MIPMTGFQPSADDLSSMGRRINMRLQLLALALAQDPNALPLTFSVMAAGPANPDRRSRPGLSFPYLREVFNQSFSRVTQSDAVGRDYKNLYGDNVLHLFAHSQRPEALEMLKRASAAGLQADSQNDAGQTPLMIAALSGNKPGYKHLQDDLLGLVFTADAQLKVLGQRDRLGLSVLDYAVMGGLTSEVDDLLERGLPPTLVPRPVPSTLQLAINLHGQAHPITRMVKVAENALLEAGGTLNRLRHSP